MAARITLALTFGTDSATMVLTDPIGPNNPWKANPDNFLSQKEGDWTQGFAANPVIAYGRSPHEIVLQFEGLDTFNPKVGKEGSAIHFGVGGKVPDSQVVHWKITSLK
jgi:hypothetical protein